jgi:hypothetical protein
MTREKYFDSTMLFMIHDLYNWGVLGEKLETSKSETISPCTTHMVDLQRVDLPHQPPDEDDHGSSDATSDHPQLVVVPPTRTLRVSEGGVIGQPRTSLQRAVARTARS